MHALGNVETSLCLVWSHRNRTGFLTAGLFPRAVRLHVALLDKAVESRTVVRKVFSELLKTKGKSKFFSSLSK